MDQGRNLTAHLDQRTLNLGNKLEKGSHHAVSYGAMADTCHSPYEGNHMSSLKCKSHETTGKNAETSSTKFVAVKIALKAIKCRRTGIGIFKRLEH